MTVSPPSQGFDGLEVWRGSVGAWECDEMGHMNVRFYVARAMEGLTSVAAALGLAGAFRPDAQATLRLEDHHIRFLREARAGAPLIMRAGIVEMGESHARILQLLIHAVTGELAATFQAVVSHVTSREGRVFAFSPVVRERAAGLAMAVADKAAPRSLDLAPPSGRASLAEAERLGLVAIAGGAFGAGDCDVFGRVGAEHIIGVVAGGIPILAASLGGGARPAGVGGAVLEYRLAYADWPRAGDRYEVRSGLIGFDDRTQRLAHWILDPATGAPWATSEAVAISLDLAARKIISLTDETKARLAQRVIPGLCL
ncbi:MAG TPA: thioesterase family protein [Caulobacteraceae bacterium]|nr:thioesterase family protein [Caulobacteraceae bacterium]